MMRGRVRRPGLVDPRRPIVMISAKMGRGIGDELPVDRRPGDPSGSVVVIVGLGRYEALQRHSGSGVLEDEGRGVGRDLVHQ